MKPSDDWSSKLFNTGLLIAFCSYLLVIYTKSHYHFVFLPEYYGSFSNLFWQKPKINFEPGLTYLHSTTGLILVSLTLGSICLGFAMMYISTLISKKQTKQWLKEDLEQWLKENNVQPTSSTTRRNPRQHRKLKKQKPNK